MSGVESTPKQPLNIKKGKDKLKIVIVGPGAMGLLLYSFLRPVNTNTYLLDKDSQRTKTIKQKGIRIFGVSGERQLKEVVITTKAQELSPADLVFICVKSYHTESAIKNALPCITKDTYIVSFQNGLGNAETIQKFISKEKILIGVTNHGATLVSQCLVKHAGKGDTTIGCFEKTAHHEAHQILKEIVSLLRKGGFDIQIEKDIEAVIWSKLIINVGINALTAITNFKNGKLIEIEELKNLMHLLVAEAYQVANAKKIKLLYSNPYLKVEEVCALTCDNISSMLQDILKGKNTEIDAINGAIVKEAKNFGLNAPYNEFVTNLVHGLESKYGQRIFKL